MPPYSGGRWGAHRPSALTRACTFSRRTLPWARSSSLALLRRPAHSAASLGRISSLTIRAVRIRMSLMWSLSPAIGVTVIGIVFPQVLGFPRRCGASLRGTRLGVPVHHPATGQGPFVAAPADEADCPTCQRRKAVLEAGEEGDVDHEPQRPPDETTDLHGTDVGHGAEARDHRQR